MHDMFIRALRFSYYVVHRNLHHPPNQWLKDFVHQLLVCSTHIFKTKWHYLVTEQTLISDKRRALLILLVHWDLVIS